MNNLDDQVSKVFQVSVFLFFHSYRESVFIPRVMFWKIVIPSYEGKEEPQLPYMSRHLFNGMDTYKIFARSSHRPQLIHRRSRPRPLSMSDYKCNWTILNNKIRNMFCLPKTISGLHILAFRHSWSPICEFIYIDINM